jgi:hypothetical protein
MTARKSPPLSPQERDDIAAGVAFYVFALVALVGGLYALIRVGRWLITLAQR